jgi:hypothetical protein
MNSAVLKKFSKRLIQSSDKELDNALSAVLNDTNSSVFNNVLIGLISEVSKNESEASVSTDNDVHADNQRGKSCKKPKIPSKLTLFKTRVRLLVLDVFSDSKKNLYSKTSLCLGYMQCNGSWLLWSARG